MIIQDVADQQHVLVDGHYGMLFDDRNAALGHATVFVEPARHHPEGALVLVSRQAFPQVGLRAAPIGTPHVLHEALLLVARHAAGTDLFAAARIQARCRRKIALLLVLQKLVLAAEHWASLTRLAVQ